MKLWPIFLIILISLVLVGCGPSTSNIQDFQKDGYGELDVVREEGASYFPRDAHQGNTFDVQLVLNNEAIYDASNVRVLLAGFDNAFVELQNREEQTDLIEGRSIFNNIGGFADFRFQGLVKDLQGRESESQNYFLHVNYESSMEFTPKPCIGTRQRFVGLQDSECDIPEDPIHYNGQGAPLAVESMEVIPPSADGGKIEFRLKIRDRGKGDIKKVRLEESRISNKELNCAFRGESADTKEVIFPEDNELELFCSTDVESQNRYTTTLFISFSYDYERIIRQSVELKGIKK